MKKITPYKITATIEEIKRIKILPFIFYPFISFVDEPKEHPMLNQIVYTSSQKEALQYLYKHPGSKKLDDIMRRCNNFNYKDLLALCSDEYGNLIKHTIPWSGERFEITPAGRAVVEAIKKQAEDESYQRDYDAKALETAKESNDIAKAAKKQSTIANWLSGIAIVVSILSAIIAFCELRS